MLSKSFWVRRPLPWIHGHSSTPFWCLGLLRRRNDPLSEFFQTRRLRSSTSDPCLRVAEPLSKSCGTPVAHVFDPWGSPRTLFRSPGPVSSIDGTFSESFWILGAPAFGPWSVFQMILGLRWLYLCALGSFLNPFVPLEQLSSIHRCPSLCPLGTQAFVSTPQEFSRNPCWPLRDTVFHPQGPP